MKFLPRGAGIFFLLALIIAPATIFAQENAPITVVGSGVVSPVFQALADASKTEAKIEVNVTGTNGGFTAFCAGQVDITTANRPISVAEDGTCTANGVNYVELLLAEHILAFRVSP